MTIQNNLRRRISSPWTKRINKVSL